MNVVLITSYTFILIVLISLFFYWLLNKYTKIQNIYLLLLSYFVYGLLNTWLVIILLISTVINFFSTVYLRRIINDRLKKLVFWSCVIFNTCYLVVFKYFDFFSSELGIFLSLFGFRITPIFLNLFLPIGISFYTLVMISYNVEVYEGKFEPIRDFIAFALSVAFFPKLTAGPITKTSELIPQITQKRNIDWDIISRVTQFQYIFTLKIFIEYNIAE